MSTQLGTAYVQILPSAKGIAGNITKELDGEAAIAGQKTGTKIGGMIKRYIGAAAIGATIKKSLEEGAKLEQSLGGVETLYKKHADIVIKNANQAYKTAGLSANDYMEQSTKFAASLLQSTGGNTKKAAKYADMAIIDMSDNANKFGTNIEDIQNAYQGFAKQNYIMLDNLRLGYGGTKTEMERLLSDAEKISGQKYDISNLSDVYDAIHVVQEEMGVTGTTSKEASETLAGSFASMKAAATNFLGNMALGENVGPSLKGLIDSAKTFLIDNLIPAILNIAKSVPSMLFTGIKEGIPALLGGLASLVPQIIDAAINIVDQLTNKLVGLVNGMAGDPAMAEGGLKIVGSIAKAILIGAPKLAVALAKLALTIPVAIKALLGNLIAGLVATLGTKLSAIVGKVKGIFNKVKNAILDPTKTAKEKLQGIIDKIKGLFNKLKLKLNLKIPHISLSGGKAPWGIAGKGKLPSFKVKWAAQGGIVDGATLIGAGEKGSEAIVPLDPFWDKLEKRDEAIDYDRLTAVLINVLSGIDRTNVMMIDGRVAAKSTAPYMKKEINGLDTRAGRALGIVGV